MDPYDIPADLSALTPEQLADLEEQGVAAFDALGSPDDPDLSDDTVAEMERIAGLVGNLRAEANTRETQAGERRDRAAAAIAAMKVEKGDDEQDPPEDETPPQDQPPTAKDDEDEDEKTKQIAASATPAPARQSIVRQATRRSQPPVPAPREARGALLTAAADIPGVVAGSALADMRAVTEAFMARSRAFPTTDNPPEGLYYRYGVATFSRGEEAFDGLWTGNPDYDDDYSLIVAASKESRLPDGSLTASGGWCAPSETIYDLCGNESTDGLVDLPEIQVKRGGIRFTTGPDFSDIYTDAGFCQTEAQAIAGTAKPCVEIECPTFEEVRLDACGICVKAPILTNAGYPELVQRWITGTEVAHQHKMSAKVINSMVAALPAEATMADVGAASFSVLNALELAAEGLRYKFRMSFGSTLEVVAPHWLRAVIRADLAQQTNRDSRNVSDAEITAHFANRGVRVQFVYDWQPLTENCPTAWPDTVNVLIYPAGTFVKGVADVISLDTVYDTAGLTSNMYTAVFAEEGVLVAQVCYDGCNLAIPLCISGRTGAADITDCYGATG